MHVSVSRCAEMLAAAGDVIDRSALSRYCDTHGLKLGRVGKEVMVDYEAVRAHRADNYQRQVMSGGVELPPANPVREMAPPAPLATVTAIPERSDPARELKQLELRRRQREEAIEEGQLTGVAEIDAGAAEAIVEMRSAFAAARADFAERLGAELGIQPEKVRVLRAGLKRFERAGQTRFAERMARTLAAVNEAPSQALDRLNVLAGHAMRLRGVRQLEAHSAAG